MSKLKSNIANLSEENYNTLYNSLLDESAEKTAFLLRAFRENSVDEKQIIKALKVKPNAYYTLRSRLNQKIESLLLNNCDNPNSITNFIFTNKKSILPTALKYMEKKVIKANDPKTTLATYKYLKKVNIGKKEFEHYDNLYKKQLDILHTIDTSECLLAEYFYTFGKYFLSFSDEHKKSLGNINQQLNTLSNTYDNDKLYVFKSFSNVIHLLFVFNKTEKFNAQIEDIDNIIENLKNIINDNKSDEIYKHIWLVVQFLEFEYLNHFNLHGKSESLFKNINTNISKFMTHYYDFTFPALFLMAKIKRYSHLDSLSLLEKENEVLFINYENDYHQLSTSYIYVVYRALSSYYCGQYEKATSWINDFLNHVSLKDNVYALIEIKTLLALQYCILDDFDLFNQLIISIQRQIRILKKKNLEHILIFIKILKTSISIMKKKKKRKIEALYEKLENVKTVYFSPILYTKYDENIIERLVKYQ